jgi:hypothetical protein
MKKIRKWFVGTRTTAEVREIKKMQRNFNFSVREDLNRGGKTHVDCVRDGSEHEAK